MSKRVIGIDLGTGNSAVATIENGVPTIIVNSEGHRTTPSVIGLKNGERKVGETAKRQRVVSPKETISLIKRFMGVDYDKCGDIMKHVLYNVVNVNGKPRVEIDGRQYSPEELSSMILLKMKQSAEDFCGEEVTDAVITCPAWFDNNAREATKLAGEMAGLKVHRIINEPTAAILASDIKTDNGSKIVLVADIGAGTTDFSVCEISDGMVEVLASKGDVFLGGSDFDNKISEWILDAISSEYGIDLKQDQQAMQRILEAAESAKLDLSTSSSTDINLPYIALKDGNPIHFVTTLSRATMEHITEDLVKRIVTCAKEAVEASKIEKNELSTILMVGGQSRSLAIREALRKEFNVELNLSVNPDEAVALGAAVQANIIVGGDSSNDILLLDVTPISMGIETMGGIFTKLIEANTTIPCKKTEIFSTAVDNQSTVDIRVLQGERPMAKDNKEIGLFRLDGILPAKRGVPQIEVTFDNKGDQLSFSNEKMVNELADKLSEDDKKSILDINDKLKAAVKNKDVDEITSLETKSNEIWNKISSKIYGSQNEATNSSSEQDTKDATYEEVK